MANVLTAQQLNDIAKSSGYTGGSFSSVGLPTQPTPATPTPTPIQPAPISQTPPVQTSQPSPTTVNATPYTGTSIVDALNQGGQASDFASRTKLAQQYGIQNYAGTADQNTQLLNKYKGALSTLQSSGQPAPTTGGTASQAVNQATGGYTPVPQINPIDTLLTQDKGYQDLLKVYSDYTNSQNQQKSLVDTYTQMTKDAGIEGLNTQLMNSKKIIDGTEQDIRNEISAVGGFATESQVQGLAAARNKTLIQNYNTLLQTKQNAMDNINTMIGLSGQDRQYAQQQFENQLNVQKQINDYRDKFVNNAKESYNAIVQAQGYGGLYNAVKNSPTDMALVEKTLGLAPGQLAQMATYQKPLTEKEKLDVENQKLQNQKLKQEIGAGPKLETQVVDLNGKKVLINSKTGAIISEIGGGSSSTGQAELAQNESNITNITGLLSNKALSSAVGPNTYSRGSLYTPFGNIDYSPSRYTGATTNFISGVQQLTSQLSLDSLVRAKAQGATFGALSEGELKLLSSSASKLDSWAVKDKQGNVTGYNVSQKDFKSELDRINNFAKLDYVLKGGSPESVGVQVMPNGKYVTKNSDGTYQELN